MAPVPPPPYQVQRPQKKTNTVLIVVIVAAAALCVVLPVGAALVFPLIARTRVEADRSISLGQARDISRFLLIYALDNDDTLPAVFESREDLYQSVLWYSGTPGDMFYSYNPNAGEFLPNSELAGIKTAQVITPESAVLIFESAPWNDDNGRVVGYLNGQSKYVKNFAEPIMLPVRLHKQNKKEGP